jgi:hypothetical protein
MKQFSFNQEKHFIGQPCKRGHIHRWKSNGSCAECHYDRSSYNKTYNKSRLTKPKSVATALFLSCRNRQKAKYPDAPFDLTKEWIEQKITSGICEVTGLPFNLSVLSTAKRPFAPSIDKKDPKGYYTKDNCQVVCFIYNVAKSEFTHDDVVTLANAVCNSH